MSRSSEFEDHTQRRCVNARDFLDVEAEVSDEELYDDDDEENIDGEDLTDFIDDGVPLSSSRRLDIRPPLLPQKEDLPVFQHIIDRYENRLPPSVTAHVSSAQNSHLSTSSSPGPSAVPPPIASSASNSGPTSSASGLPGVSPPACWTLLRDFARSNEISVVALEERMQSLLGEAYDHSVWSKRYDKVLQWEDDWLSALDMVDDLEAEEAAAATPAPAQTTPVACWDLLRAFCTSEDMSLVSLEQEMRALLGDEYDHSIWSPRFDAVGFHEDNVLGALGTVDALQSEDAAKAAPPDSQPLSAFDESDLHTISSILAAAATKDARFATTSAIVAPVYNDGALVQYNARTEQEGFDDARNAIRMHYRDETLDWRWYHVHCLRGVERTLLTALRTRWRQDLVKDFRFSFMPGRIYLQVRSMLSNNTPLHQYLKTFPYFLYPHGPDSLPIHELIPDSEVPPRKPSTRSSILPYGSWVRVTSGIYKGDVMFLFPVLPLGLVSTAKDRRTGFMLPRRNAMRLEPFNDERRPPLSLLRRAEIDNYINSSDEVVPLSVICPVCEDGSFCSHPEERKILVVGHQQIWLQSGLRMWTQTHSIKAAASISAEALTLFLESRHPALQNPHVISNIPPISSWQFFENDHVLIRATAWGELCLSYQEFVNDWNAEGVIQKVDLLSCVVLVKSEPQSIPKTRLRRKIDVKMMVELLPGATEIVQLPGELPRGRSTPALDGKIGFVTGLDDESGVATVSIDQHNLVECHVNSLRETKPSEIPMITQDVFRQVAPQPDSAKRSETYTGVSPWIGIAVIVLDRESSRRGQLGSVHSVRRNEKMLSGLEVYVRYETISAQNAFEWVDYHWVRHQESYKFLHDDGACQYPEGYWSFKPGYKPEYTSEELHVGYRRKFNRQVTAIDQEDDAHRTEEARERQHEKWTLELMRVEMQRGQTSSDSGTQAAASLAALKRSQQSVERDESAWDPSSKTPPHPSDAETPNLHRYWLWQPPPNVSLHSSNPSGGMTPRHGGDSTIRDGGAWDPSAMTPQYDRNSVMPDGSAWDPQASTPIPSSSTPIHPSSIGATTGSSPHWLASHVLCEVLQGLDIIVKISDQDDRVYLSLFSGLVAARQGKRTTRAQPGRLVPFTDITQATVAANPEQARKLYIVIRGRHLGKIGRCVGKWVNTSNQYDYRLAPVRIQLDNKGTKWRSELQKDRAIFIAQRWDLVAIHETNPQMSSGNLEVAGL